MEIYVLELSRMLGLVAISFILTILWTPALTHLLYKYKLGKQIRNDGDTPVFTKLHQHKEGTPTMGGVLIWGTVLFLTLLFSGISWLFPDSPLALFNFLDRGQTYLPLAALVFAALVGLADDVTGVRGIGPKGGGIKMRHRIFLYTAMATVGAWWFVAKLQWSVIDVPFAGQFEIGLWYIPFFVFVIVATAFSVNETDGLDGLAGGVMAIAFASYGIIAFAEGRYELAAFTAAITGALLAFLWFNIPPARFFMGDTGAMALGVTLGVIAMLTNMALILPLVGSVLVLESLSVIIQITSRKITGKKVFRSAPIHHHFQAIGWPEHKIVMRLWVISAVMAGLGIVIGLIG